MLMLTLLTVLAVAGLLVAEHRDSRAGIWLAKPLASTGFLAVAVAAGALDGSGSAARYGTWVLTALVLSWWGDVFLIPQNRPSVFRAGILSFLLGHVAFAVAFAGRGFDVLAAGAAVLLLIVPVYFVVRWLRPHVPRDMVVPVYAYVAVISAMLICAAASIASAGRPAILLGATMFYLSDLAVARDRFVAPGMTNRVWGLPLYYGAQLILASTVAPI